MTSESTATKTSPPAILLILLIAGSFAVDSFLRFPIPGTNEPHYLCKAKHYWNPQWCEGDFFLESSNAHRFFYQVVGFFTQWLTLTQTVVIARLTGCLLLAIGWFRLLRVLTPGTWSPLIAAALYLGIAAFGNFSGEWIIGGIESKVFAYGFLFLALANACEQHWNRAGVYLGLTICWHPIVGVWGLLCALFALLCYAVVQRKSLNRTSLGLTISQAIPAIGWLIPCSLPGLIPALSLLQGGTPREEFSANFIQVFYRLKHHLDPMDFDTFSYLLYGSLLVAWLIFRRRESSDFQLRFFQYFIAGTLGLACVGLLLGAGPRPATDMPYYAFRMSLLKFYPFRLFDSLLPLAVTVTVINVIYQRCFAPTENAAGSQQGSSRIAVVTVGLLSLALFGGVFYSAWAKPPVHKMTAQQRSDWLDACHWIEENTPESALFLTPIHQSDFKWYAQRPEYVTYKDCPQDAPGIVEWNRRLKYLRKWGQDYYNEGFDDEALQVLKRETGITHLLVKRLGPFKTIEPVYQNPTYKIYQLP